MPQTRTLNKHLHIFIRYSGRNNGEQNRIKANKDE